MNKITTHEPEPEAHRKTQKPQKTQEKQEQCAHRKTKKRNIRELTKTKGETDAGAETQDADGAIDADGSTDQDADGATDAKGAVDSDAEVEPTSEAALQLELILPNNHSSLALLDSGATADFIDSELVDRLKLQKRPVRHRTQATLASTDVRVDIIHSVSLTIQCNGLQFRRGFYVYPGLVEDIVLGRPFLKQYARELDFAREEFNGRPLQQCQKANLSGLQTPTVALISAKRAGRECKKKTNEVFTLLVRSITYSSSIKAGVVPKSLFDLTEFSDVVRDELPPGLPPNRQIQHSIEVIPGSKPTSRPPHRLTYEEKKELTLQIEQLLSEGKIEPCGSPYGAPVLFVRKKDGSRRLCVDYRGLNANTIRERFPLPLIDDIFDTLAGAKVFSSLDLHSGYHQVRMNAKDVYKTAFVTPYGQYAWRVMPFGLTNAPATFQHLMNHIFRTLLNRSVVIYLDDILVFSKTVEEHRIHLRQVLEILRTHKLVAKAKKCYFFQKELQFLGHVLSADGIRPNPDKVKAVREWSNVATVKQAQSFLGLTGFYRRFIADYASYTSCIHDFIAGKVPWSSTHDSMVTALKAKLTSAPILILPNPIHTYVVYTDASNYYMGAVLHQIDDNNKLLGVVAYESKKFDRAELNYPVREKEFYAVIHALQKWRHFLLDKEFILYTDHESLKALKKQAVPTGRLSRWMDFFEEYAMDLRHIKGSQNVVADWLSRKDTDLHVAVLRATNQPVRDAVTISLNYIRTEFTTNAASVTQLQKEYATDPVFAMPYNTLVHNKPCPPKMKHILRKYHVWKGLLYYSITTRDQPRLCIPQGSIRALVLQQAHDSHAASHRGNYKTYELVARQYYWSKQFQSCCAYVQQCATCQKTKVDRQAPAGLLSPLEVPAEPWQDITMDFVSGFPMRRGCDRILVVVDRLTKQAHFIPCPKAKFDAGMCARLLSNTVFRYHGFPETIVSDQDTLFKAEMFRAYTKQWNIKSLFSTVEHPETDGQSERSIGTVRELLRSVVHQSGNAGENWVDALPMIEFAYNNSVHTATGVTPFFANTSRHPRLPTGLPVEPFRYSKRLPWKETAECFTELQHAVLVRVRNHMAEYQLTMQRNANAHRRDVVFRVGDAVLVRRDKLFHAENAKKFFHIYMGPFRVVQVLHENAYRVHITAMGDKAATDRSFNITSLKPYNERSNEFERPPPTSVEEVCNNLEKIERIVKASTEQVTLAWKGSTFPVTLTYAQYTRITYGFRRVLENTYRLRNPDAPEFSSPRRSVTGTDEEDASGFPSTARV
ncbi:hypothetical protein JCM33374_g6574 [Metschnikowia sp. JCM 33374]|nr:hypothetical protein JCM33374_g6574 [Metschnikowia sp. JCM 33374]